MLQNRMILRGNFKPTILQLDSIDSTNLEAIRQAKAGELNFVEPPEQFPEWVIFEEQIAQVDREDFVLHEIEILVEAVAVQVRVVGVPAGSDARMIRGVEDGADVRQR